MDDNNSEDLETENKTYNSVEDMLRDIPENKWYENIYYSIYRFYQKIYWSIYYRMQILLKGHSDLQVFEFSVYTAEYILPRLIDLKECSNGYPSSLDNHEEWIEILEKMIVSFKMVVEDNMDMSTEQENEKQEGLDLFGKYYTNLWD